MSIQVETGGIARRSEGDCQFFSFRDGWKASYLGERPSKLFFRSTRTCGAATKVPQRQTSPSSYEVAIPLFVRGRSEAAAQPRWNAAVRSIPPRGIAAGIG